MMIQLGRGQRKLWYGHIIDGRVFSLVWFPKGVSVNADNYLKLLRDVLWPSIQEEAKNE